MATEFTGGFSTSSRVISSRTGFARGAIRLTNAENGGPIKRAHGPMFPPRFGSLREANMFTDGPVTPIRLECLIDLLREYRRREWNRPDIIAVLQPKGLPDLSVTSPQAAEAITAASELGLITQDSGSIK